MSEVRDKPIMVHLEPTFFDALQRAVIKDDTTASSYIRSLIIEDLLNKGLITHRIVTLVTTGRST